MQRTIRKSALALALALAAGNGHAQSTTGSIVGSVPPGAGESSVLITNTSGFSREVKVDERGRYAQGNLPLGTYTVTLKRDGQVVETRENISLVVGAGTEVGFGGPAQTLDAVNVVAGNMARIDVASVDSRTVITAEQLAVLPLGRSAEAIALLAPGVVANSGGYNWMHDNRISVIDLASFKLEKHIEAPMTNLFQMAATKDRIWVSSYGEASWYQDADGNWLSTVSAPQGLVSMTPDGKFTAWVGVHANKMTLCGNTIVCFGNDAEMEGGYDNCLYFVNTTGDSFQKVHFSDKDLSRIGNPYAVLMNESNNDLYIADASFTGGSKVHCFDKSLKHKWTVSTGVGTGHLLLQ
jgi:hypothetical protein